MSKYFHILFKNEDGKTKLLGKDLSKKELKNTFLDPFKKGKDIFIDGEIFKVANFKKVQIIETDEVHKEELKSHTERQNKIRDEQNKKPGPSFSVYLPRKTDILYCGKDVTTDYLSEAPSDDQDFLLKAINNSWTVTIIGGLILALIIWAISNYFGLAL